MNVIFDISNVYYRSYFKCKKYFLEDEEENKSILIRKFFIDFCFICNSFINIDKVICCFDSRSYRKDLSKDYKSNRTDKKEPFFYEALDEVKYFLYVNGFITLKHDGLEADDLIYLCSNIYDNNCIISNDEDIRQYLNKTTVNLCLKKEDNTLYISNDSSITFKILNTDYSVKQIDPIDVTISKIFLGCNSDIVPKLAKRGIGEKNLQKLIILKNQFVTNGNLDLDKMIFLYNGLFKETIEKSQVEHNLQLINLSIDFDESIFINNQYSYNEAFRMQNILKNSKYLKKDV